MPSKPRATWAAVALAVVSLCVQVVNFWRSDLKPVLEQGREQKESLLRIEKRLEDHERRLGDLEQWQRGNGVWKRVSYGETGMGETQSETRGQNSRRR